MTAAVEFTVLGVDKASQVFDDVGESARQSADKISRASNEAASGFDNVGESAGDLASWSATLGDGLATLGENMGGTAGGFLQLAGNGILAATAFGDIGEGAVNAARWIGNLNIVQKAQAIGTGIVTAAQWAWNAAMNANPIGLIITGIVLLIAGIVLLVKNWDTVKDAGAAAWQWIKGVWASAAGWMNDKVIKPIVGFFTGMWGGVKTAWSGAGTFFSGIGDGIKGSFKGAFNAVARFWNDGPGALSWSVPDWVPGIGGKTLAVPNIPYLFTGGTIARGGWAVVGERGPELVNLPTNSRVYPNHAPPSGGGGPTVKIENFHAGGMTPAQVGDAIDWMSRR